MTKVANNLINVDHNHAGVVATELARHLEERFCLFRCFKPLIYFMIKTPWHGAQTTLYCALDDKIEKESGFYYSDCARKTPTRYGQDMDAAKKLWEISEELVGLEKS